MKRSNDDREWVLDNCPQLVSLKIFLMCLRDEDDEDDDDYDGIMRSITFDLPSLEKLCLRFAHTVKKCTLTCPKLVDIELMDCWRMVALNFDGGAQLHRLNGESGSSSSYVADHKKWVFLCVCVLFIIGSLFIIQYNACVCIFVVWGCTLFPTN